MRDIIRNLIAFFGIILIIQLFKWRKIQETSENIKVNVTQNGNISGLANLKPPHKKKLVPNWHRLPIKPVPKKVRWSGWDKPQKVIKPPIPKNLEEFLRFHPNENIKRNYKSTPISNHAVNDAVFYRRPINLTYKSLHHKSLRFMLF